MNGRQLADHICRILRDRGHQAYLVGGCVRDILLGREPVDYDVATDATPDRVQELFPKSLAVGAKFGVVIVTDEPRLQVEVATFRSDVGYSDGRHPDQRRFSKSPEEDVQRRDFTINGLLLDPVLQRSPRLRRRTRRSRRQNHPRHRRSRSSASAKTSSACSAPSASPRASVTPSRPKLSAPSSNSRHEIHQVSARTRPRRTHQNAHRRPRAPRLSSFWTKRGLLPEVLPEIAKMKGVEQPPQFHPEGDVWIHTLLMLEKLPQPAARPRSPGARCCMTSASRPLSSAVAPDRIRFDGHVEVGVKMAEEICRRLRFSNDDTEQILALVEQSHALRQRPADERLHLQEIRPHAPFRRAPRAAPASTASPATATSAPYDFTREKIAATAARVRPPRAAPHRRRLIAAGYTPGPRFKEILAAVEDAQLNGTIHSREEALRLIRDNFTASPG